MRTRIAPAARLGVFAALALVMAAGSTRAAGIPLWSDTFEDGDANCWSLTNSGATIAVTSATANGGTYSLLAPRPML